MSSIVSTRNLLFLTAVAAPAAGMSLSLTAIIPQELTRSHGVTLNEAGAAFLLIRLADIFIDPFLGGWMDRTQSRLGRYQVWILAGAFPVSAGMWMCFFAPPEVSMVYLVTALAAAYLGFSMMALSHLALCAAQSDDYQERGRIFAWWQSYTTIGLLTTMLLPKFVEGLLGFGLVQWMGITLLGMIAIATISTVFIAKTRPARAPDARAGIRAYLALFTLTTVRRVMAAELLLGLAAGLSAVAGLMFMTSIKDFTLGDFTTQIGVLFLVSTFSAPLWAKIAQRIEKHRALIWGAIIYAVGQFLFLLVPPGNLFLLLAGPAVVGGFAYAATFMLPRAMIADIADEEKLVRGADRTALLYALLTGIFKMGHALSVGIGLFALSAFGYVPQLAEKNSSDALMGVAVVYSGLPILCALLALLTMIGYPLTSRRHREIQQTLAERQAVPQV